MIEITGLTKDYGKKHIIKDVSIKLDKLNYGLVGPNGAGKTTLLRMITGYIRATSGQIRFDEGNKIIGYLPQKFGCIPELTVYEQLEYFACLKNIPAHKQRVEVERVIGLVNLEEKMNEKCSKISGGMVRRIGIAQALLGKPDILLLDEPTVGLDLKERETFKEILVKIRNQMAVIISTHIIDDVADTCDEMIILSEGMIKTIQSIKGKNGKELEKLYFELTGIDG